MSTKWDIVTAVAAGVAVIASIVSLGIAQNANRIAEESIELEYQTNLPIVTAISKYIRNEGGTVSTEEITITNGGSPLKEFGYTVYTIITIASSSYEDQNIYLVDYFNSWDAEHTGNNQGLLCTVYNENNYSQYLSMQDEFWQAAEDEDKTAWIDINIILSIIYFDQFENIWHKYLHVNPIGSYEMEKEFTQFLIESSMQNSITAQNRGLELSIDEVSGAELWEWYKTEVLKE